MNRAELKKFITGFYQAWQERDENKIADFYDSNVKAHADFKPITKADMLNRFEFVTQHFSQSNYHVDDLFIDESEGKIAIRMHQNHQLLESDREIECEAIMLYTVKNYKITEIWMSYYPNVDYTDNTIESL
jgi:ketosteroid isomerase-like protein